MHNLNKGQLSLTTDISVFQSDQWRDKWCKEIVNKLLSSELSTSWTYFQCSHNLVDEKLDMFIWKTLRFDYCVEVPFHQLRDHVPITKETCCFCALYVHKQPTSQLLSSCPSVECAANSYLQSEKLYHFLFAITLSNLFILKQLLARIYFDKCGTKWYQNHQISLKEYFCVKCSLCTRVTTNVI